MPRRWTSAALAAALLAASHDARASSYDSAPVRAARDVLARIDAHAKTSDLRVEDTIALRDGDVIVRFAQTYRGLPVLDRGAAARLDARGGAVLARSHLEDSLPPSITPRVDAASAAAATSRLLRFPVSADDATLVIAPHLGAARLAWAMTPRIPVAIPSSPFVLVDANDGTILLARERAVSMHRATVYVDNPVRTPVPLTEDLPIDTLSTHLESAEVKSLNCVDRGTIAHVDDGGGGKVDLRVCDLEPTATSDADGLFSATPDDDPKDPAHLEDPYSEVSMYFHVSRAYQFFRGLRGDATAAVVDTHPLLTVSNLRVVKGLEQGDFVTATNPASPLVPFQNAFFAPSGQGFGIFYGVSGGSMWFGQGPKRDYAYDGDVVYHEFTHGVVDKTLQLGQYTLDHFGLFDAPGAMNEGLADYFSSALAGDPEVGEYAAGDITDDGLPIRSLANGDTCPGQILGEAHFDSTVFSGGLYAARTSLPESSRSAFDAALYASMLANPHQSDLGYADLIQLFLDTLAAKLPEGHDALQREMTFRGLLPECERVVTLLGDDLAAPSDRYGAPGYVAPGVVQVGQDEKEAPGVVQIKVPMLPSTARRAAIRFVGHTAPSSLGTGQGTEFSPSVLVKMGSPITWSAKNGHLSNDATVDATPTSVNDGYEAAFDLPAGVTALYFQVVNRGEQDGLYDHLSFGDPTPASPAQPSKPPAPHVDDSGCSCDVVGASPCAPWAPFGAPPVATTTMALVALVTRRRKKRRTPREARPE